jgi:myo-inositol-1(or 4)-monophosphatase
MHLSNVLPQGVEIGLNYERFDAAKAVIMAAGALASDYFNEIGTLTVKVKGAHDLVSEADLNTEKLIRDSFAEQFPNDFFFGEETGLSSLEQGHGIWVVDPIDGTQPFLNGMPMWCISIAYVESGKIEFGLIYDPCRNELFAGGRDIPATLNGRPIAVHQGRDFSAGMVSIGYSARSPEDFLFSSLTKLIAQKGMFFRNGSGALSLAYVGAGRLLGHVEPHMNSWDCLAGIAIIEAAGGKVSNFLVGDALLKGNSLVAGTPSLFEGLSSLLVW